MTLTDFPEPKRVVLDWGGLNQRTNVNSYHNQTSHLGQDVVLSCRVEPPSDLTNETLEWTNGTDVVHVYRSRKDDPDPQVQRFFNRTSLITEYLKDGIASLTLTNFTNQDEGNYSFCLPELLSCSDVTLTESKLAAEHWELSVYVFSI
uniref:Ig-like domain-containing protein n=1 Tax=Oryzias latipes TaxID=8090 RepID=A0A3B3IJS4_ORYLA